MRVRVRVGRRGHRGVGGGAKGEEAGCGGGMMLGGRERGEVVSSSASESICGGYE